MTFNLDFCQINQMRKNFFCSSPGKRKWTRDKDSNPLPRPRPTPPRCCDSIKRQGSEFHKYFQLGFFPPPRFSPPDGTRCFPELPNMFRTFGVSRTVKKVRTDEKVSAEQKKIGQEFGDRKIWCDIFAHKLSVADMRPDYADPVEEDWLISVLSGINMPDLIIQGSSNNIKSPPSHQN